MYSSGRQWIKVTISLLASRLGENLSPSLPLWRMNDSHLLGLTRRHLSFTRDTF
jgi:hypothetical protein